MEISLWSQLNSEPQMVQRRFETISETSYTGMITVQCCLISGLQYYVYEHKASYGLLLYKKKDGLVKHLLFWAFLAIV